MLDYEIWSRGEKNIKGKAAKPEHPEAVVGKRLESNEKQPVEMRELDN